MRITKLTRDEAGVISATVTSDDGKQQVRVHNRYGSWLVDGEGGRMLEVKREVALAMSKRARQMERARRGEVETSETPAAETPETSVRVAVPLHDEKMRPVSS